MLKIAQIAAKSENLMPAYCAETTLQLTTSFHQLLAIIWIGVEGDEIYYLYYEFFVKVTSWVVSKYKCDN